jgi:hypothetical protein
MIRVVIPDPDPDFLPIPDPGSRGQKGIGSRIGSATDFFLSLLFFQLFELSTLNKTHLLTYKLHSPIITFQVLRRVLSYY